MGKIIAQENGNGHHHHHLSQELNHLHTQNEEKHDKNRNINEVVGKKMETSHQQQQQQTMKEVKVLANEGTKLSFLILIAIFAFSLIALFFVYKKFPNLEENEKEFMKLPRNIEDAKNLGVVLSHYKDKYYFEVLGGVFITYIFLQTFAIPGSIFLSIMSGFLFPFSTALFLICFCSATGASFCYLLSKVVGRKLLLKYCPEKVIHWSEAVGRHRDSLLNYMIFLRVTPFLPNWFINLTAPVVGVPIVPFWIGTFIGVAPPSFVAIHAGTTLHHLSSTSDAISWETVGILIGIGFASLAPIYIKRLVNVKEVNTENETD